MQEIKINCSTGHMIWSVRKEITCACSTTLKADPEHLQSDIQGVET